MVKLKNQILREVGAMTRSVQSISDSAFRQFSLQRGQFIFLTRICENPGINLIDLSQTLCMDKTTTTKAVQKLIREEYVRKERDSSDRRIWHLFPSEKAAKTYPLVIEQENHSIDSCCEGLTEAEKAEAYRLLKKMRENIEAEWRASKNYL